MTDLLILLILIGAMIVIVLIVPQYLMSLAVPAVIRMLRDTKAIDPESAKSTEELGLTKKSLMQGGLRLGARDYKPKALVLLLGMDVIKMDDEDRIYLNEGELSKTKWRNL